MQCYHIATNYGTNRDDTARHTSRDLLRSRRTSALSVRAALRKRLDNAALNSPPIYYNDSLNLRIEPCPIYTRIRLKVKQIVK